MIARRDTLALGLLLPAGSASAAATGRTRLYELTYLQSLDPNPAALIRFIEQNWFAMDAEAVRQGLMTSYSLLRGEDPQWNLVCAVGYPDPAGYAGIDAQFEAIRKAHRTVLVDGKGLKELGRITGNRKRSERGTIRRMSNKPVPGKPSKKGQEVRSVSGLLS